MGVGRCVAANLHLHCAQALRGPSAELFGELCVAEAGEPSASVDRNGVVRSADQVRHRQTEDLRLEVPQRDVDRRNCRAGYTWASLVANRMDHRCPRRTDPHWIASEDDVGQGVVDDAGRGRGGVGVAESGC